MAMLPGVLVKYLDCSANEVGHVCGDTVSVSVDISDTSQAKNGHHTAVALAQKGRQRKKAWDERGRGGEGRGYGNERG